MRIRHTMGQDWGGRRKQNPNNAPKVSGKMVRDLALEMGLSVKRDGYGMWFVYKDSNKIWYTLGSTNFLAFRNLQSKDHPVFE